MGYVLQGISIDPPNFLIHINYMMEGVNIYTSLFTDDAKGMKRMGGTEHSKR